MGCGHGNAPQRPILPNRQSLAEYNLLLIWVEAPKNYLRNKYSLSHCVEESKICFGNVLIYLVHQVPGQMIMYFESSFLLEVRRWGSMLNLVLTLIIGSNN